MFPSASMTVGEILSGPLFFNVPAYQRPFDWTEAQAVQLVEDVLELSASSQSDGDHQGYFLGTILLMDQSDPPLKKLSAKMPPRVFDVVDGQQRLITLLTMMAVLRDIEFLPSDREARIVASMMNGKLGGRFFKNDRRRIGVLMENARCFEQAILAEGSTTTNYILDEDSTRSNRRLVDVRDALRIRLQSMTPEERRKLFHTIFNECHAIVLASNDIDRAHRLFVVLNERGKRLQRNDILKADLLSRLPPVSVSGVAKRWDQTSQLLGEDFEQLFSHLRTLYGETRPQIVAGIRALYDRVGGPRAYFDDVVEPMGVCYRLIKTEGKGVLPPDMSRSLRYLNRLSEGDWVPPALLAIKKWQTEPERSARLLAEIERYAYLSRLLRAGSGHRVRRFARIVAALLEDAPDEKLNQLWQLKREEEKTIAHHLLTLHKRGTRICKLLLLRLSDEMQGASQSVANMGDYTIEHVLPQKSGDNSNWRKTFMPGEVRDRCIDSLGNLVLVTPDQNDKARDKLFAEKCKIYADMPAGLPLLAVTSDIFSYKEWTPQSVMDREKRLASVIEKMWRINLDRIHKRGL